MDKNERNEVIVEALKIATKIPTSVGVLGVERLFQLPMTDLNLTLANLLGEADKLGRLKGAGSSTVKIKRDIAILEAISDTRDEQASKNTRKAVLRQTQGKLLAIRRRKEDAELENMSTAELDKLIAETSSELGD